VRCINFFHSARAGRIGSRRDGKSAYASGDPVRRRREIKISDVSKTHIPSAFLHHGENLSRNRASKIIIRAIAPLLARSVARTASGGGVYTQN
jgi:hypothetical protein